MEGARDEEQLATITVSAVPESATLAGRSSVCDREYCRPALQRQESFTTGSFLVRKVRDLGCPSTAVHVGPESTQGGPWYRRFQ
jgi:hypothetical protein